MSNEPVLEISTIRTRLENVYVDLSDFWVGFMPEDPSTLRIYSMEDVGYAKSFIEPLGYGPPTDPNVDAFVFKSSAKPYRSMSSGFWLDCSRQFYTKEDWDVVQGKMGASDREYGSFNFPAKSFVDPARKFEFQASSGEVETLQQRGSLLKQIVEVLGRGFPAADADIMLRDLLWEEGWRPVADKNPNPEDVEEGE